MAVSTTTSSPTGLVGYTGTLQEVLDALTTAGYLNTRDQVWTYNDTGSTFTCVVPVAVEQ